METKVKTVKPVKSQKGKWGHVGAPPKAIKLPKSAFTVKRMVTMNPNVCELTVRKYIAKCLKVGVLKKGTSIPQPKGKVGCPSKCFVPTGKAFPLKAGKPAKAVKAVKAVKTPASTPVVSVVTPAVVPVESTPVAATTPVVTVETETPAATVTPMPLP